tara:strand:- start:2038 stop:3300 length:1263 start_codon:yes stop_codon:yes gene_type:complete
MILFSITKMKKIVFILIFAVVPFLDAKIEVLDRIAIIVDDGVVMESQIDSDITEVLLRYQDQNIQAPPIESLLEQIRERLIIEELQIQLAERAGIKISDAELNITITRIAQNNELTLNEFIDFLDEGGSYEDFREQIRKEMTIQRVQGAKVGSNINITEKEFEAFLATDESLNSLQPELLVRQILLNKEALATELKGKIDSGENFETLAKQYSQSSTASNGGLMSWRRLSEMPGLFAENLSNKSVGYVSNPIESGSGFHILKLEDKRGEFVQFEDQWEVRHILMMPTAIRNEEDTKKEINSIRERIINGEDFDVLAKEFSDDPGSANQGGNLGWQGTGVYAPEFEEMMISIEQNLISDVFQTQFGFHFLEVLNKRNFEITDRLIEDRAYQILYSRKYDEELENTLRTMRAEAFVEIKNLD